MAGTETTVADEARQKALIFAWLDALRSGDWTQAKEVLETRDGDNCCLGVACRMYEQAGYPITVERDGDDVHFVAGDGERHDADLPRRVKDAMGLRYSDGRYEVKPGRDPLALASDNDHGGKTFPQIADIIEANAATLFVNGPTVAGWIAERKASAAE